nr:immunoglobulin light chain junction region [Macaca mulatta]MPO14362.1 immunoglobulin light chain junction region [Macaca mulatta]
CMIWHNSAYIF